MDGANNTFDWKPYRETLFGFLLAIALAFIGYLFTQSLEREKMVSEYLKALSDTNSPAYTKSAALVALCRLDAIPDDLLFTLGYKIQNETGDDVLKDLFYEYGYNQKPIRCPIGYVDLLKYNENSETLEIDGWAIDNKTPTEKIAVSVWLNNDNLDSNREKIDIKTTPRPDIDNIFRHYGKLSANKGFSWKCKISLNKIGKKARLRVGLVNSKFLFMHIMDADVCEHKNNIDHQVEYINCKQLARICWARRRR